MRKRNVPKRVWLSKEEDQKLKSDAQETGLKESVLVRELILGYHPCEKPDDRFYEIMKPLEDAANKLADIFEIPYYHRLKDLDATPELFKNVNQVIEDIDRTYNYKIHQK